MKPTPINRKIQCNHCPSYFDSATIAGAVHLASCRKYNGYTNYETWAVAVWLDNDCGSYDYWRERAKEAKADSTKGREVALLASWLRSAHEDLAEDILDKQPTPTVLNDLLNAALCEVEWTEIAENILEGL